jgi:hypothetical protein
MDANKNRKKTHAKADFASSPPLATSAKAAKAQREEREELRDVIGEW